MDEQKAPTLADVKAFVRQVDSEMDEQDSCFHSAVVLASGLVLGPNVCGIARFTGYGRKFVRIRAARLFKSCIWFKDGKMDLKEWFVNGDEEKLQPTVFILDAMIANGNLYRTSDGKYSLMEWLKKGGHCEASAT